MIDSVYQMLNYGIVLSGRVSSCLVRNSIDLNAISVFDFEGVRTLSHSFADELFGKIAEANGQEFFLEKIKIINSKKSINEMIELVVKDRLKKDDVA